MLNIFTFIKHIFFTQTNECRYIPNPSKKICQHFPDSFRIALEGLY